MNNMIVHCEVGTRTLYKICLLQLIYAVNGYVGVYTVRFLILLTSCFMTRMLIRCLSSPVGSVCFAHLISVLSNVVLYLLKSTGYGALQM
jgi:hypothetical protein